MLLHWSMALLILSQLLIGFYMVDIPKNPTNSTRMYWFNLHKSLGIFLLVLFFIRIYWLKIKNQQPEIITINYGLQRIKKYLHHFLYFLMFCIPVSGILGSLYSGYPIRFFNINIPVLFKKSEYIKSICSDIHQTTNSLLILMLCIHIAAFIYHQYVKKEPILQRIL